MNVSFLLPAIQVLASSCAARASSQSFIKFFIFSSIEGYLVCSKVKGIAMTAAALDILLGSLLLARIHSGDLFLYVDNQFLDIGYVFEKEIIDY